MKHRSPIEARGPRPAREVEPPAIGGRRYVPDHVGRVDPGADVPGPVGRVAANADVLDDGAQSAPDASDPDHVARPSGSLAAGSLASRSRGRAAPARAAGSGTVPPRPPTDRDGDGHELFTHIAVPTQRVRTGPERTERIQLRHLLIGEPVPAVAPPGGVSTRSGSIGHFGLGGVSAAAPAGPVAPPTSPDEPRAGAGRGRAAAGAGRGRTSTGTDPEETTADADAGDTPFGAGLGATTAGAEPDGPGAAGREHGPRRPPLRSRRKALIPVIAGAALAAAVALASAGLTGSLVSEGPEVTGTLAAAGPSALDPAEAPVEDRSGPPPATVPAGRSPAARPPAAPLGGAPPSRAATPAPAAERTRAASKPVATARTIMIIPQGETTGGAGPGASPVVDRDGPSLSPRGLTRARSLSTLFVPTGGRTRTGIARPSTIYAADPTGVGVGRRTRETVTPLADRLGVPIDTSFGEGQEAALARSAVARSLRGPVLISWPQGGIPGIVSALKVVGPRPPSSWPDSRHDLVWTFTQAGPGAWRFAQTPQLLLPGDSGRTIR